MNKLLDLVVHIRIMKKTFIFILLGLSVQASLGQELLQKNIEKFSHQDSLRGSITKERAWWDLKKYHLDIKVNPLDSTISGSNTITYQVLENEKKMQIDLQQPMQISKVIQNGKQVSFQRDGNVFYLNLTEAQTKGSIQQVQIFYNGKPKVAVNPPWDGGITWKKDANGKFFIASSCQGLGASVWWPNKDHMYDEVENMLISVNVPSSLTNVSNGRLQSIKKLKDGTSTFTWYVANPINNYGVNINIGDYVSFSEKYKGEKGNLDCTYYVLRDNLAKAKKQFKDVPKMLKAFEHWFGPYPFYEDSYKLVEAPYLGMEHQSSVTYGNGYQNGYRGRDLSGTGWGLKFDFIIIHESGHEWFANNITYKDIADMWIHESFTNYSESLFLEYYYGKEAGYTYVRGLRNIIENDKPIIGKYDVNNEGSGDMYPKGANMLHTIRQLVNNDKKWRQILRGLNSTFYHQTVTTKQIEDYLCKQTGIDLSLIFNQYLRDVRVPKLEYSVKNKQLLYRWTNTMQGFNMPLKITLNGKDELLQPENQWKTIPLSNNELKLVIDPNFYVETLKVTE